MLNSRSSQLSGGQRRRLYDGTPQQHALPITLDFSQISLFDHKSGQQL